MNKSISVGDLVQVVRGHACDIGNVGVVQEISVWGWWYCPECHACETGEFVAATLRTPISGAPLEWLKRIPPLEELEGQRTEEKIHEPA
jgi:hypothetical protein